MTMNASGVTTSKRLSGSTVLGLVVFTVLLLAVTVRLAYLSSDMNAVLLDREIDIRKSMFTQLVTNEIERLREHAQPPNELLFDDYSTTDQIELRQLLSAVTTARDAPLDVRVAANSTGQTYLLVGTWHNNSTHFAVLPVDEFLQDVGISEFVNSGLLVRLDVGGVVLFQTVTESLPDWQFSTFALAGTEFALALQQPDDKQSAPWMLILVAAFIALTASAAMAGLTLRLAERDADVAGLRARTAELNRQATASLGTREELEQRLLRLTTTDAQTGFLQPETFMTSIRRHQALLAKGQHRRLILLSISIARLPELRALDERLVVGVMQEIVQQVQDQLSDEVVVCRYYENCLMILYPAAANGQTPNNLADLLVRVLSQPLQISGRALRVDPRVSGAWIAPESEVARTCHELASGRTVSDPAHVPNVAGTAVDMYRELPGALQNGEIEFHYQPLVDANTQILSGFESLVRWRHPTAGMLPPGLFLPVAQAMDLMGSISAAAINNAISQLQAWQSEGLDNFYVGINLQPDDFLRVDLCGYLLGELQAAGVAPSRLRLEVTEQTVFADGDNASRVIDELRDAGIVVMLDDFGTGYSSMSYLREIEPGLVKLDKSFIDDIVTDARAFGLMKALVDMLHYLQIDCVAEGIESAEQLELARVAQVDYIQGYYFSAPVPLAEASVIARAGTELIRAPQAGEVVQMQGTR